MRKTAATRAGKRPGEPGSDQKCVIRLARSNTNTPNAAIPTACTRTDHRARDAAGEEPAAMRYLPGRGIPNACGDFFAAPAS
jgi:hypothetical protein